MNTLNNLFWYLKKNGNKTIKELPLNEVDALIFSAFTYLEIEDVTKYTDKISIKELYKSYQNKKLNTLFYINQNRLLEMLSKCIRFQNILVTKYLNIIDKEKDLQIGAMTFEVDKNILFVAFKGTDKLVGWKEDLDLGYKEVIPAQQKALEYLDEVLSNTLKKVYVGGHSKGGNLAMYAGLFCKHYDKIVQIYNMDGPGFSKSIIHTLEYQIRNKKIITFIPKASIVGNLLNKDTKTIIIKSKNIGFLQHNLYSWEIVDNHFVYEKEVDEVVLNVCNYLNEIINRMPSKYKEQIVEYIYHLLEEINIDELESIIKKIPIYYK